MSMAICCHQYSPRVSVLRASKPFFLYCLNRRALIMCNRQIINGMTASWPHTLLLVKS